MEKYDEYKDSGVDWIGDVPCNWQRTRIKFGIRRSTAGVWGNDEKGNGDDVICFRIADFDYPHGVLKFDNITLRNIERNQLEGRLLSYGDLLIEKSGGGDTTPVGRVVRVNYKGKATYSNFIHSVTLNEKLDSNFMYYYFYFLYSNKVNLLFFNQTTGLQNLKVSDYLSQSIYIPPINEQQAIANYLDKQCSKIDKAIATQEKRIELLGELKRTIITDAVTRGINPNVKMKDSGVEWIGEIPEHWEVKRMRYLCDMVTGDKDTIMREENGKYPFYVRSPKIERINTYSFDGEAVLMAGDGVGAGKVIHYATGKFDFHQRVYNFHHFKHIKGRFLYYYLISNFRYKIEEGGAKNTVDSVRLPWLKDFQICVPTIEEQNHIMSYIEKRSDKIDSSIAKVCYQIDLLKEYKKSLITEVVTGKRKVI